ADNPPVVNRAIPISATCRYIAYVLLSSGEPAWVNLGEAKPIEDSIDALRQALRDKKRTDVKVLARKVDALVMQPIRKALEGVASGKGEEGKRRRETPQTSSPLPPVTSSPLHLFLSPDASLNLIPFAALVDEQGKYLVEQYSFTYLTSGRDLLRLQTHQPSKEPPVVIADVDFNLSAGNTSSSANSGGDEVRGAATSTVASGPRIGGLQFEPLQELLSSLDEANTLKRLLKNATVWTKQAATE